MASGIKIDVWGDSILKGVVLDEAVGRYRLLKDCAVNTFASFFHIDVRNHSHFGCTAPKALASLEKSLSAIPTEGRPDLVLLEFGGNDCDYNWQIVSDEPDALHQPNTTCEAFSEAMKTMALTLREKGMTPVLMTLPPIDAVRYFDWVTKPATVNPDNVLRYLVDKQFIYRHQERYSLAIARLAAEEGLPLIDVRDVFLRERDLSSCLCNDGIHPNEKGQNLIQKAFAERYMLFQPA